MAKRKEGGIELMASLPWPFGIILGILGYLALRYGIGMYMSTVNNPVWHPMGSQLSGGAYAPLAWLILIICWAAALASFIGSRRRKALLERQTGLDSLRAISWREFEVLVGEAFRRQGYAIQETGLGGADGGIDLVLRKDGKITLVQCKQWITQRVDVKVVREMFGLLAHHGADAVKIVAVGNYTVDALRFARGKPIELIHGEALLAMVRKVQTTTALKDVRQTTTSSVVTRTELSQPAKPAKPAKPVYLKCGTEMVMRSNRQTKDHFWGCINYR